MRLRNSTFNMTLAVLVAGVMSLALAALPLADIRLPGLSLAAARNADFMPDASGTLGEPMLDNESLPFASALFRATHNSYSGNRHGAKGSILQQLEQGVRLLEFDIHDNDYPATRDYGIGHIAIGDEVDYAGNPATNGLRPWLHTISQWSAAHQNPKHAPLTVLIDLKDDLTDNPSFSAGNLTALNWELRNAFGSRLVLARDMPGGLPSVGSLRGRILTVLSGDRRTREEYRRDLGYTPAVAINSRGQVVEVHDSGDGVLWYWTGTYAPDGTVEWIRHGRYDTGRTPAVALNDNGWLVEVHQGHSDQTLWYRVGQLSTDGEISWSPSRKYDTGVLPTIRFTDPAGTALREIHRTEVGTQNWDWDAVLDIGNSAVAWNSATHGKTASPRYEVTVAVRGSMLVAVWTGADSTTPATTLRYRTDRVGNTRIRYQQWAFVEYQPGDGADLATALFYAAPATASSFITSARANGRVVRGWDFDDPANATAPLANFPATNYPSSAWYLSLTNRFGLVQ